MPSNNLQGNVVAAQIAKFTGERLAGDGLELVSAAPLIGADDVLNLGNLRFAYNIVDDGGDLPDGDLPNLSEGDSLPSRTFSIDTVTEALERKGVGKFDFSDFVGMGYEAVFGTSEAEAGLVRGSLADQLIQRFHGYAWAQHSRDLYSAADELNNTDTFAIDETFPEALDEAIDDILRDGRRLVNTIVLPRPLVTELKKQSYVQKHPSVSLAFDSENNEFQSITSGYASYGQVAAYFAEKHGLNLVVSTAVTRDGASREFVGKDTGILCHAGGDFSQDTFRTFTQMNEEIVRTKVVDTTDYIGQILQMEGAWKVKAIDEDAGLKMDFS